MGMGGMSMEQMMEAMAMMGGMFNSEQASWPMDSKGCKGGKGDKSDKGGKGGKGFKCGKGGKGDKSDKGDKCGKGKKGDKGGKGKADAQEAKAEFAAALAAFRSKNNMGGGWT